MKHTMRNRVLTTIVAAGLLCGSAVAAGTVTTKMIEANYMGIKIVVDGKEVTPTDASGKAVEPFASSGTTYLPVRAIGEALGKEVTWDGSTATVYVGDIPGQESSWMKKLPPYQVSKYTKIYDGSDHKAFMAVGGEEIMEGVQMKGSTSHALWNTNLKYSSMTFTVGHIDGSAELNINLDVYLDGQMYDSYEIKWDEPPKTITIPLNRAANIKLQGQTVDSWNGHNYGIYHISFS
ncbi:MAG: copper amine oxidase N-terminal domain-containing protein [Clostridiales bacterium]|uniref:stalk domain-containing protein n=1 Tax=Flavonifractor porci TaxID=3133422 RepID=UPI00309EB3DC|nr:copper amine oxidase N-terminal domain-containing protein [Clostridiales bacterium]